MQAIRSSIVHVLLLGNDAVEVTFPSVVGAEAIVTALGRLIQAAQDSLKPSGASRRSEVATLPEYFLPPSHPLAQYEPEFQGQIIVP
jgi:hypothetical protein